MKTIFTQQEIQQALVNYMELQGIVIKDRNISISFTKGRGSNALTAEVDIEDPKNIFAGKEIAPVAEETLSPEVKEFNKVNSELRVDTPETPPFTPDEPKDVEPQAGSSAPSSDPLPKTLFQRD